MGAVKKNWAARDWSTRLGVRKQVERGTILVDTPYLLSNNSGQEEPSFECVWSAYDTRKEEKRPLLVDLDEVSKGIDDDLCIRVTERRSVRL